MNDTAPILAVVRRWRWWAAASVLAILAIHSAAWFVVTGQIIAALPTIRATAAANGWLLDGDSPERAGWPLIASVRIPHPVISGAALRWSTEMMEVAISPLDPGAVHLSPHGAQSIRADGLGVPYVTWPISAGRALLRVPWAGDAPASLDATDIDAVGLHVSKILAHFTRNALDITELTINPRCATCGPALPVPFDGPVTARLTAILSSPLPPAASPAAAAADWQAHGGIATIQGFDLRWGTLHATGSGQARLDAALQPVLQAQLRVDGAIPLLDAAERAGLLAASPARAARTVISLLSLGSTDGSLTAPLQLLDGTLSVARFPLLRVPPLRWAHP